MLVPHEEIFNLESPSGSPVGYSSIDRPTDYREVKVFGISIGSFISFLEAGGNERRIKATI
jgi:hypothetical protein